jgi:ankyrin repeat protein
MKSFKTRINHKSNSKMTLPNINDIKRISKVFQGLVDFIEDNRKLSEGITVTEEIQSLVLNLHVAHETFDKGIAEYMHAEKEDLSEIKTVEKIIGESPYYLTVKDEYGNLPIHSAAWDESSLPTLIPLLAKAGIQHGVGGESGRGGLLVENSSGTNTLTCMTDQGNFDAMKALLNAQPPLLIKSDIVENGLIHKAVKVNELNMMKMMIEMDPKALYKRDSDGNLPIHCVNSQDAFKLLLQSAVDCDPNHSSIGGLFTKDGFGYMAINLITDKFNKKCVITCLEQVLSTHKDIPILHKAILYTPRYVRDIIENFPDSCFLRDDSGRLPIHVSLETGMKWSLVFLSIMNANSEHLGEVDPVTKLHLGDLAAVEPSCGLRTINYLMLKHPKNVNVAALTSDEERCKRRKLND